MSKVAKLVSVSKSGKKAQIVIVDTEDKKAGSQTLHVVQSEKHRDLFQAKDGRVFNRQKLIDDGQVDLEVKQNRLP